MRSVSPFGEPDKKLGRGNQKGKIFTERKGEPNFSLSNKQGIEKDQNRDFHGQISKNFFKNVHVSANNNTPLNIYCAYHVSKKFIYSNTVKSQI